MVRHQHSCTFRFFTKLLRSLAYHATWYGNALSASFFSQRFCGVLRTSTMPRGPAIAFVQVLFHNASAQSCLPCIVVRHHHLLIFLSHSFCSVLLAKLCGAALLDHSSHAELPFLWRPTPALSLSLARPFLRLVTFFLRDYRA